MSFLKKLFSKSSPKLHLANLNLKIDFAFSVLDQFTPLVSDGIEDLNKLKHNKELIKNSILFLYRELQIEPGKTYILEKHLKEITNERYDKYLSSLSQILIALSNFSHKDTPISNNYLTINKKLKPSDTDFLNNIDAFISGEDESRKENEYYFSELRGINTDLKNGSNFKKIKYYDMKL